MAVGFYINMCGCALQEKSSILINSEKEQAAGLMAGLKFAMTFIEDGTNNSITILSVFNENKTPVTWQK